ncbi:MAG: Uma2 family endonuclease [Chloroflexaceae bacterium]|nr:Uma2 family endonuclease [Chloroflexaceae bacterium]
MIDTVTRPTLTLRSLDAAWNYERWERELPDDGNRYEIIDGVLYMTTAPSFFHQWISNRLYRFVAIPLEDQGLAYGVTAPIGLIMPGCDPVQPDFVLVSKANAGIIADRRIRGVPDLIAEVLSPNNPELDTATKRQVYARAGVPEYWVVRPATRDVLVYRTPDSTQGDYTSEQVIRPDATLTALHFPVSVAIANLFAGAPDTTL